MSALIEATQAQVKILGKYCHACNKFKQKEEFTAMRKGKPGKCDVCMSKHHKPKEEATKGGVLSYMPKYRG